MQIAEFAGSCAVGYKGADRVRGTELGHTITIHHTEGRSHASHFWLLVVARVGHT